jgi:hypothetical protein
MWKPIAGSSQVKTCLPLRMALDEGARFNFAHKQNEAVVALLSKRNIRETAHS